MRRVYIITGANGHLGGALVRALAGEPAEVRGLILPGEAAEDHGNVRYYRGDVCQPETLRPLFEGLDGAEIRVIHTAGIVDISGEVTLKIYDVNVTGTRNVAALCREFGARLVYVSSVHAIPEAEGGRVQSEIDAFSPDRVVGGYAKTKAEATQLVLDAARAGLDAVVVHPSGILGPFEAAGNHMVQMVSEYVRGRLPACVVGGYDFVDVRDVAQGCLLAAEKGRRGECYILSNRRYEIRDLLRMIRSICGGRRLPVLPMWVARAAAPVLQAWAKLRRERPLYTRYSLYALSSNSNFSHDKATMELGYRPRDLFQTMKDTVAWLKAAAPARGTSLRTARRAARSAAR